MPVPVVPILRPAGIIDLGPGGWTNSAADGVRVRLGWTDIQPLSSDQYDWSKVDSAIAQARDTGKQLGLSVAMLADAPVWLQARRWVMPETGGGHDRTIVLPWDTYAQPAILAFCKALCRHVDGKVNYIAMGGLGAVIESYICPDPATVEETMTTGLVKWSLAVNAIIETHAANLLYTPFIFTAAKPFMSKEAMDTAVAVCTDAAKKYPRRFGMMDCSLGAQATAGYPPHKLVSDFSASNPVGLQFLTSSHGFTGHELGGTVQEALDAAIALKAHYVEVYPFDSGDPANIAMFRAASAKLKANLK